VISKKGAEHACLVALVYSRTSALQTQHLRSVGTATAGAGYSEDLPIFCISLFFLSASASLYMPYSVEMMGMSSSLGKLTRESTRTGIRRGIREQEERSRGSNRYNESECMFGEPGTSWTPHKRTCGHRRPIRSTVHIRVGHTHHSLALARQRRGGAYRGGSSAACVRSVPVAFVVKSYELAIASGSLPLHAPGVGRRKSAVESVEPIRAGPMSSRTVPPVMIRMLINGLRVSGSRVLRCAGEEKKLG
jgi:hypothetical protein